ncbi:MAG: hypothetical protein M3252_08460 [Actinomycetota bacterium]|nr:hypothetical protein [Actinomycetota bacterium]
MATCAVTSCPCAIAGNTRAYLTFMLPGMLAMNMLFATVNVAHGVNSDLTSGVFDRLRSLADSQMGPSGRAHPRGQVKQAWAMLLVLGVGMLLGFRVGTNLAGVFGAVALLLVSRWRSPGWRC